MRPVVMRVVVLKIGPGGVGSLVRYYDGLARDQLARDGSSRGPVDYYIDADEPPGRWWGTGRQAVGLEGDVVPGELARLLQAQHPLTGRKLGRGFGETSARSFDATFSAPKSVSLFWALTGEATVRAEVLATPLQARSGGASAWNLADTTRALLDTDATRERAAPPDTG